jgi:hypothetical protein
MRQTAIYYLQRAVTPDWMGSIALGEHIMGFFSRAEKPSEDIISRLFLMNMKGLSKIGPWRQLCIMKYLTPPPPPPPNHSHTQRQVWDRLP